MFIVNKHLCLHLLEDILQLGLEHDMRDNPSIIIISRAVSKVWYFTGSK